MTAHAHNTLHPQRHFVAMPAPRSSLIRRGRPPHSRLAEHYLRRYPARALRMHRGLDAWESRVSVSQPSVREIPIIEIARSDTLRADFVALHRDWTERGLTRWLSLLDPQGRRPVLVMGAFDQHDTLLGAVIGVWHPRPCERFDDLFAPTARLVTDRPADGAWHLIAVTTSEHARARNVGLARLLLGCILARLAATGHTRVRTLSPALGLPELARLWATDERPVDLEDAVMHAARSDGRPVLQVMRLHLGGGAVLERVLLGSRADDLASGRVNLRFAYATDPDARLAQKERWQAWVARRAARLTRVHDDFAGEALYRAEAAADPLVREVLIE